MASPSDRISGTVCHHRVASKTSRKYEAASHPTTRTVFRYMRGRPRSTRPVVLKYSWTLALRAS